MRTIIRTNIVPRSWSASMSWSNSLCWVLSGSLFGAWSESRFSSWSWIRALSKFYSE